MDVKNLKVFDTTSYKQHGEGATAIVYASDKNPKVLVKVFKDGVSEKCILDEYTMTKNAMEAGLNVPAVIDIVSFNGRPGIVYERIINKKSLSRAIADNPERLDEYMKLYADNCKYLHSLKVDTSKFPSLKKVYEGYIDKADFLNLEEKNKLRKLLSSVPDTETLLHGDLHTGNVIVSDNKIYFIDLGGLSYGNPILDESTLYFLFDLISYEDTVHETFHMNEELLKKCFNRYCYYYYGDISQEELDKKKKQLFNFSCFFSLFGILVAGIGGQVRIDRLKKQIAEIDLI